MYPDQCGNPYVAELRGALDYAAWNFIKRNGKVTYYAYANNDRVEGRRVQLTNTDRSKTFVAIADDDPSRIFGFYALTACEVVSQELPSDLAKRLPRKIPGIRLGRLAVDRSVQGQGLGEVLLMNAIDRSRRVLEEVGVHALFVDAKDANAAAFYRKYGFRPLPEQPLQLVLVIVGL